MSTIFGFWDRWFRYHSCIFFCFIKKKCSSGCQYSAIKALVEPLNSGHSEKICVMSSMQQYFNLLLQVVETVLLRYDKTKLINLLLQNFYFSISVQRVVFSIKKHYSYNDFILSSLQFWYILKNALWLIVEISDA